MRSPPTADVVRKLINNITETMFGLTFIAARPSVHTPMPVCFRSATMKIPGMPNVSIVLSTNERSCVALGAAMFACQPETVDASMIEDTLRELTNMAAGHFKRAMELDAALTLPVVHDGDRRIHHSVEKQQVHLKSGEVELNVQIAMHD